MNNRQGPREDLTNPNVAKDRVEYPDGRAGKLLSVQPDRALRDEAVHELADGPQSRPWWSVVNEWRDWYDGYLRSNIEFEGPDGETVRSPLENSYMPSYGRRYYAKLKDLERAVERELEDLTTVMLTFTASHRNANGGWRCPADHMRDIMGGYDAARKQVHQILDGYNWEYARVWESHADGYGHLHFAVFVEDPAGEIEAGDFAPAMRSHVGNCSSAGWDAHDPDGDAVSLNREVNNLGSYISEYIGIFGQEAIERPVTEQMFYATAWATGTRRVDFSNGAQDMMARSRFRRETGLRPEDRGGDAFREWRGTDESDESGDESEGMAGVVIDPDSETVEHTAAESGESGDGDGWTATGICTVRRSDGRHEPSVTEPGGAGIDRTRIVGRPGTDPPKDVDGPPPGPGAGVEVPATVWSFEDLARVGRDE